MDPSATPSFQQTWSTTKDHMMNKHRSDLAFHEGLLEKEKQELCATHDHNLDKVKTVLPATLFKEIILPMAEKSLKYDLQQLESGYQKRTRLIEKSHAEDLARQQVAYHEDLRVKLAATRSFPPRLGEKTGSPDNEPSLPQDVSTGSNRSKEYCRPVSLDTSASRNLNPVDKLIKPLAWTIQHETISGERRLIMRVRSKKRKASLTGEAPPKRLRLDTAINSLRTPVTTPSGESARPPERTITFDEVYQNGNAKHKDVIVEWPSGSKKWYILKCEKHNLRFKRNPVQGAAKHLNGVNHGFPDRNRDMAVRTLGYLVLDCDEGLVKLNNQLAEETYASGHKSSSPKSKGQPDGAREVWQAGGKDLAKSPLRPGLDQDPGSTMVRGGRESSTSSSQDEYSDSGDGITSPKTFHIYYGQWGDKKIYPVMILGWDRQDGSGLEEVAGLGDTGLLNESSHPPNCYQYGSNKIVGWAPGYEDGGPKVKWRRFPIMFFDEGQTTAWFPAKDLMKFPLYKRKAPAKRNHPFNAARRWIAKREGFQTWEKREEARISARRPSVSPLTPANEPFNMPPGAEEHGSHPVAVKSDMPRSKNDSSNSDSESVSSNVSTETERLVNEWREKGGEIEGDEDYATSGSDIDDTLDCEMDGWNPNSPSSSNAENSSGRPWAFYGLRNTKDADGSESQANLARKTDNHLATSVAANMESARKLGKQAYPSSVPSPSIVDSHGYHEPPGDAVAMLKKESATAPMQSSGQPDSLPSDNEAAPRKPQGGQDSSDQTIKPALGSDKEDRVATATSEKHQHADRHSKPEPQLANPFSSVGTPVQPSSVKEVKSNADFELSSYGNEVATWKRQDEHDIYVQLFISPDKKTTTSQQGSVDIMIDPLEILSFSKEVIPGTNGNHVLVLRNKNGSLSKLTFDRSEGSKLEISKIQSRRFIRWIRDVNPNIKCLET